MKFKGITSLLLLITCIWVVPLSAQRYSLPEEPEKFIEGVNTMLSSITVEEASFIKSNFDSLWNGDISGEHQQKIIEIARLMLNKNHSGYPNFFNFFSTLTYAYIQGEMSTPVWNNFYSTLLKSVESYKQDEFNHTLLTLKSFFQDHYLYKANFNSLHAEVNNYDFEFIEDEIPEAESLPSNDSEEQQGTGFDDWDNDSNWDSGNENDDSDQDSWDTGGWDTNDSQETQEANENWGSAEEVFESAEDVLYGALTEPAPQPIVEGAVMTFKNVTFTVTTSYDSTQIQNTSGSLMLKNDVFVGEGGKFDWYSAGLDPNNVFVTLDKYHFEIDKPYLEAEAAKLTYRDKIDEPVEGIFLFESKRHSSPATADYPRFKSYSNDIKVKGLAGDDLIYRGGFSLRGQKIIGNSVIPGTSSIELQNETGKLFYAESQYFTFGDSTINGRQCYVTLYHQRDSIHHPVVKFRYYKNSKRLIIQKEEGGFKNTPFWASYYNMDIQADLIRWDVTSDSLDIMILNARNQIPALFESREYFNSQRLNRLSGVYGFNPLLMATHYSRQIKSDSFYYQDMADALNQKPAIVEDAMKHLWQRGYIEYNPENGKVTIKQKAKHYILANFKRKDFDDLLIPSLTAGAPNATLHLDDQELTVRGIEQFFISKPLNVSIFPEQSEITLLKNRDFKFNGQMFAGNFEFIGRDFTFRYDSFLIDMVQIDSIRFYIEVKDEKTGEIRRQRVDNKLVSADPESQALSGISANLDGTSGTLFINQPDNKSSREFFPQYPLFDAARGAVVYFDNKEVLDSAYDKSVYFVIPPFKIDSLSNSDPASIGFEGRFISGGIVPEFDETLHIMPDNTMGFEHKVPSEGYNLYNGTGKIYNYLSLDSRGLNGHGTLDYLTTTLFADQYVFYLDSVTSNTGVSATIENGTLGPASFPDVEVDSFNLKWLPQKDSMYVKNLDTPFRFYDASASLYGTTVINKNGLYGAGRLYTRGSESESEQLAFTENDFSARHARFEIKSDNENKPALAGNDVRLNFDLINDVAEINPEIEGVAAINFPYAQYKTSISKAVWDLDNRNVTMTKPEEVDLRNSYFYTTREELDSLAFNATKAEYNIDSLKLYVSGIPFIKVADAMITPENNEVTILENARMGQLTNTTIVIDTLNQYHKLIDGTVDIKSRNEFIGSATYQFVNATADTFNIEFGRFNLVEDESRRRTRNLYTVSGGTVDEKDSLIISPGMIFQGKATMYAIKKPLELDGQVKLDFKTVPKYNTWIKYYSDNAERQEVQFDFKTSETTRGESLTAGLHFSAMSDSLYATFITDKITPGDPDFFVPDGVLSYNLEKGHYQIVDTLKVSGETFSGEIFTFNESTGDINFEGPMNFMTNSESFILRSSGIGNGNFYTGEFSVDAFLSFEMDIPSAASVSMGQDIFDVVERIAAPEAHDDINNLLYKASEIFGENNAREYEKRVMEEYIPLWAVSNDLVKNLVLSEVNLKWSSENKAWYNEGKIGLSNILKQDVNAMLDGFIEIRKGQMGGDIVNIFLQVSPASWYHFSLMENRLILSSSNEEFNDVIVSKTNVDKAKLGEYVFIPGDINDALSFVNRFRKVYYGLDDPYNMNIAAQQTEEPADVFPEEKEEKEITNETEGF